MGASTACGCLRLSPMTQTFFVLLLASMASCEALANCTATGYTCGSSNTTAPPCCGDDECKIPPDCGGPPPPMPPQNRCQVKYAPPPGCKEEGVKCKTDSECCPGVCHDIHCQNGECVALVPPTPSSSPRPAQPTPSGKA